MQLLSGRPIHNIREGAGNDQAVELDHVQWRPTHMHGTKLEASWGGTNFLSVPVPGLRSDYDRICQSFEYIRVLPLVAGQALAPGELKLETMFWQSSAAIPFVVQVFGSEEDFDVYAVMSSLPSQLFNEACATTRFLLDSSEFIIFDSAEEGRNAGKSFWGGNDWLSVAHAGATTDYDRACISNEYTSVVPLINRPPTFFAPQGRRPW